MPNPLPATCTVEISRRGLTRLCGQPFHRYAQGQPVCEYHGWIAEMSQALARQQSMHLFTHEDNR